MCGVHWDWRHAAARDGQDASLCLSLGAGLLVGIVVYSVLNVRSPAPPVVALVGLLGILIGEQIIPVARHMLEGSHIAAAWRQSQCTPHIFGLLPGRHEQATLLKINPEPDKNT